MWKCTSLVPTTIETERQFCRVYAIYVATCVSEKKFVPTVVSDKVLVRFIKPSFTKLIENANK